MLVLKRTDRRSAGQRELPFRSMGPPGGRGAGGRTQAFLAMQWQRVHDRAHAGRSTLAGRGLGSGGVGFVWCGCGCGSVCVCARLARERFASLRDGERLGCVRKRTKKLGSGGNGVTMEIEKEAVSRRGAPQGLVGFLHRFFPSFLPFLPGGLSLQGRFQFHRGLFAPRPRLRICGACRKESHQVDSRRQAWFRKRKKEN